MIVVAFVAMSDRCKEHTYKYIATNTLYSWHAAQLVTAESAQKTEACSMQFMAAACKSEPMRTFHPLRLQPK